MDFDVLTHIAKHKPHLIAKDGDCLIWRGTMQHAVPRMTINKKHYWIRREVFEKENGVMPQKRLHIILNCGNPKCLNPNHMETENMSVYLHGLSKKTYVSRQKHQGNIKTLDYLLKTKAEKIQHDGDCILWLSKCKRPPRTIINNKRFLIMPTIYSDKHGAFDAKKYYVGSNCGDKRCINPKHLQLIPKNQTFVDYVAAGKQKTVSHRLTLSLKNPQRKLSFNQVAEIRNSDDKTEQLAQRFNVHVRTIYKIRSYSRFKIIPTAFGLLKVA